MSMIIEVDPAKMEAAAIQIDSQASEYERQYNQLFNEVDAMGAAWQGADNIAYVTQIKGFMDDFQQMATLMKQYSEFLKSSAKAYRAVQEDRIAQAKNLTN